MNDCKYIKAVKESDECSLDNVQPDQISGEYKVRTNQT